MKYAHEFRDPVLAQGLLAQIQEVVARTSATVSQPLNIMEVCGGHTHAIFRYGLHEMVPKEVEFILALRANDPAVGYNQWPRFKGNNSS